MSWVCILIYYLLPSSSSASSCVTHSQSDAGQVVERRKKTNYKGEKVYFAKSVAETFIKWPAPKCLEEAAAVGGLGLGLGLGDETLVPS